MAISIIQLWGGAGINLSHDASRLVTKYPGDLSYDAANTDKALPKSLFYEYTEGEVAATTGLFNYYLLGSSRNSINPDTKTGSSTKFTYKASEKFGAHNFMNPDEARNPTAANIIKVTTLSEAYLDPQSEFVGQPYNVKDFIFCKNYGIVPNNRMITLRRFPLPVFDNLRIPVTSVYPSRENGATTSKAFDGFSKQDVASKHINQPISQAVTYFGVGTPNPDINQIIGFNTGLNWKLRTQEELLDMPQNDPGLYGGLNSIFGDLLANSPLDKVLKGADKIGGTILNQEQAEKAFGRQLYDSLRNPGGPLHEKIFVDVNTVNKLYTRAVGITGGIETPMTIKFAYDLTSASDINSKLLFLDLFANVLGLGTDYGKFLTPQILEKPAYQGFAFPGGGDGYKEFITSPVEWFSKIMKSNITAEVKAKIKETGKKLEDLKDQAAAWQKNNFSKIDPHGTLYKALTLFITEKMLDKMVYQPMMRSGYPTGDWHLVVGNPLNPIATIGNLICKNVKIDWGTTLGPDDFPTELYVTYTLEHARQRHRGEFESMFNRGNGRLYLGEFPVTQPTTGQVSVNSGNQVDALQNTAFGDVKGVTTTFIQGSISNNL